MNEILLKKYADVENCPVRNVLDRFGDKWSTLVLLVLDDVAVMRFNEIHKMIDSISQKMLAVTLKSLEADGLITRTQYPEIPPRVEYTLSERGASLIPHIKSLVEWANANFKAITQSRSAYKK
ncbi:MAG: transcriptional regulator [Leeuwenhoekiella sp.]|nr:MAG: transcriptional regulator [Leeuwenhoekiella sp.]